MSIISLATRLDLIAFTAVLCLGLWLAATQLPRFITWERIERLDFEGIATRIDGYMLQACKAVVMLVCLYLGCILYQMFSDPVFRSLTSTTIDTSAPSPLVPCSVYYARYGDSIVMGNNVYVYYWIPTHDIHTAPQVVTCIPGDQLQAGTR